MVHETLKSIFTSPTAALNKMTGVSALNDLSTRTYLRWDSPGVENVPADEDADIHAVADMVNEVQKQAFDTHRHVYTGTHQRSQGLVKGTFTVPDNLPAYLKQGELFTKGGTYPAAARYSTETPDVSISDTIPQPRGFAIKLFNVHGDFFEAGKEYPTQDLEFNSAPVIELADAKTTREVLEIRSQAAGDKDKLYKLYEKRDDTELQKARDKLPNQHLASFRQYSQSAFRFGEYVMKFSLLPNTETQNKLANETVKPTDGSDILHRWLGDFHRNHDAEYLFQVQLLENLKDQPVEYSGTEWDEEKYPWQTVATLKIPKQESFNYERKAFWEDHMRLDPWHGLKAYQPLGGSNRLRRYVYQRSSALRREMNGRKEIGVKSIDEIP
ncbi:hypothetical protein AMS68_002529 [Peltaster fructicola]|uniref:Uncharacterized protein n=1 Tax=Peltaster fructicola TaxID=286661 RepID=A0A6H0XQG5_9PEZI|nr:hypothetical protein AMS68_002529 [Peltaster fructicola]